ncbi:uncharacterized protein [Osmerus mordax]|uniref:uncharacterized protein n=1 Tax=Osmerus mordax TaxID=8014 RepID=UPI003510C028
MLPSCIVESVGNSSSTELKLWDFEVKPSVTQTTLAVVYKEIDSLKRAQATIRQQQVALKHMLASQKKEFPMTIGSTALARYPLTTQEVDSWSSEDTDSMPNFDPCYRYTVLDQTWRATNTSTKVKMCDRNANWKGWYRLFYKGKSLQMPERCVPSDKCGTHAPLWLASPHPRRSDGIVSRRVCGHWKKQCCAFKSTPIKVKKCRGNYYVYQFVKPTSCHLAYCADVNTIVCGRCRRSESCVSRDKISWTCKRKKVIKRQVHFFAAIPTSITGKVNRIKYSSVTVNVGHAFNRKTSTFRAPVKGIYQFYFSTQTSTSGAKTDLWLVVNGYWVSVSHTHVTSPSSVGSLSTYMTFLRRGGLVYVTQNCGNSWANAASSTIIFGGSLLSQ